MIKNRYLESALFTIILFIALLLTQSPLKKALFIASVVGIVDLLLQPYTRRLLAWIIDKLVNKL